MKTARQAVHDACKAADKRGSASVLVCVYDEAMAREGVHAMVCDELTMEVEAITEAARREGVLDGLREGLRLGVAVANNCAAERRATIEAVGCTVSLQAEADMAIGIAHQIAALSDAPAERCICGRTKADHHGCTWFIPADSEKAPPP